MNIKERNCGIDVLRIISMFLIIIVHIVGRGEVLESASDGSVNYFVSQFFFILGNLGVNCFALISGYCGVNNNQFRTKRVLSLWLQVVFYSVILTIICKIIFRFDIGWGRVIFSFFPITRQSYWYVTAYFCLLFLIPFLNIIVNSTGRKNGEILFFILILLSSVVPTFLFAADIMRTGGLSVGWLIILYLIGAIIHKHNLFARISSIKVFVSFCLCILFSWIYRVCYGCFGNSGIFKLIKFFSLGEDSFNSNFSITMVIGAISLFVLCLRVQITQSAIKRTVVFASPYVFGVYLLHDHPVIREYVMDGMFAYTTGYPLWLMIAVILLTVFIILFFGICIDFLRDKLFCLCKVQTFVDYVSGRIDKLIKWGLYK